MNKSKRIPGHERLHALVERLAHSYKGYLPWEDKLRTADVKTREMLIEDCVRAADEAVRDPIIDAAPEMLEVLYLLVERTVADRTEEAIQLTAETYTAICNAIAKAEGRDK